ncbi:hypothetical protein AMTRI_Chr03g47600 [Amborella trichopoda]|uniref:uncharacterized protein LOC18430462 isoform X2 n=1 Tax=Amborella trichopoda TaxID=13333 RepID=UPI0005D3F5A8|nr:uncharacterized protein LOC18430462 isoform X2 [Amborella trichopoda]|eukprot:XP_011622004.1 uncharacterized protein LOC18430462 isoform X2 [Amborella trichopoda]
MCHHHNNLPCLHCHPHSYIRMVQHLIERCLLLCMDLDACVVALAKHARIQPLVTVTVWKGLLKENRGFFHAYFRATSQHPSHYQF